jgi:hypothetical protein
VVNPFKDTNWSPDRTALRVFARSWIIGFPAIAAVFTALNLITGRSVPSWALPLGLGGAALGLALFVLPQSARPFYHIWYFAACCIGIVVSNALLVCFYYLVITPFGLIMRLCGRDPMNRAWNPGATTYWKGAEKQVDPERYFRQF